MHLTFSSWARCCSCNPATSCHLCSSNARRPFSLLLNCCIIMDNCLQKKKKFGSYTRSSLKIIYNLKENNKATEMFYNQHVLCSKLILFHGISTFIKFDLLGKISLYMYWKRLTTKWMNRGFLFHFFQTYFPKSLRNIFFPQELCSVYSSLRLFTYSCSWFMVSFIPFSLFCCCRESLYSFSCLFEMFSSTISIFFLKSFSRSLLSANFSRKAVISLAFALKHL